jgi:hypothetical protein
MVKKEKITVVDPKADFELMGFSRIKDRYAFLKYISFVGFAVLFAGMLCFFASGRTPDQRVFLCGLSAGLFLFLLMLVSRMLPRKCPGCGRHMEKILPAGLSDESTTYKYYCPSCRVYIDTGISNGRPD